MKKSIFRKQKIDSTKYVNIETGESLSDERGMITSVNIKNDEMVIISSNEYIIIDSKASAYIRRNFNKAEAGRILEMCNMIHGSYNLLCNHMKVPHTKETLMTDLDYTINKFRDFLDKLYKNGIIYYISGYKDGVEKIHIMLNPFLARKQKTFNSDCVNHFQVLE